jgi:phosphodiesterase/alkaline phosphatase D-like protein
MRIYETMRQMRPDFFIHSGDTIYADNPLSPELTLADEQNGETSRRTPKASRRNSRRIPRLLSLQPAGRKPPQIQF